MAGGKNKRNSDLLQLGLAVCILVLINIICSFWFFRIDLTAEKRFTLSEQTRDLLKKMDDPVFFRIYLEGDDFPAGFDRLKAATKEMLDEFRIYSHNNIEYEFVNPVEGLTKKEQGEVFQQLYKKGIIPTFLEVKEANGVTQQTLFPGGLATYKGREVAVQLFRDQLGLPSEVILNNSIQNLEYELSSAIRKLQAIMKPRIAFLEGHGELDTLRVADITDALKEYYVVERLELDGQLKTLEKIKDYKAVILAAPDSVFREQDKFILDQYIMDGGKVMFLVDPLYASMDSLAYADYTYGVQQRINLDDMFFKYGVRLNYNLAMSTKCGQIAIPINGKPNFFDWFYFPLLEQGSEHPVVKNLNAVKAEFASTIDTILSPSIKKTILLTTSKSGNAVNAPAYITLRNINRKPNEKAFRMPHLPVAVLLEGSFESVYKFQKMPLLDSLKELKRLSDSKPTKIIVVSDGDIIANKIQPSVRRPYPLGYDIWTKQTFGNKNFVLNCINYLCDDEGLLSVRSRELTLRMLDTKKADKHRLKLQLMNTLYPILGIVLIGVLLFILRKRRYGK